MSEPKGIDLGNQDRFSARSDGPRAAAPQRAMGSPLSMGTGVRAPSPLTPGEPTRATAAPGRALPGAAASEESSAFSLQRAVGALRQALPYAQRLLPLLDGQIVTAVSDLLTPRPQPPAPPVNLAPIESGLTDLQAQHRELRGQIAEQNTSLKRVEDQLEMVREATDRNTLEQQELLEDLKNVGNKVNLVAFVALGLLAFSVLLNLILFLHLQRVLP